ncbi:MAG TPA: hypothetical protein VGL76_06185 [Gaiellaceae bacterium]|jgi:hypothetical protein
MRRAIVVLTALALATVVAHAAVSQTIYVDLDADGNIHVTYSDGSPIGAAVPPGTYSLVVNNNGLDDLGNPHQFHLFGPGVDVSGTPNVQTTSTVTFQSGATYTYQDDLNSSTTRHTFVATTTPSPVTSTTASAGSQTSSTKPTSVGIVGSENVAFRGSLDAIVYADGKLTLSRNGKKVSSLATGRYSFSADDESRKAGFTVQVLHGKAVAITTRSFVGSRDVTVTLKPGRWSFFTPSGKKTTFFVTD